MEREFFKAVLAAIVVVSSGIQSIRAENSSDGQGFVQQTNAIALSDPILGNVTSRAIHSRVWSRITTKTNQESGKIFSRTNTVHEIASGLNRRDANQQVLPAKPNIVIFNDGEGAAATNGAHQCYWPADAGTNGDTEYSLKVKALNGQTLKFKPVGIAFHDFVHDISVWVSQLKGSSEGLVNGNSVIYENCMENQSGYRVDIVYSNTLAGVEQNFVFKQKPGESDLPEAFGMDPRNVWLECWTEIIGLEQEPEIQQEIRKGWQRSTIDKIIKFGSGEGRMAIGEGTAFGVNGSGALGKHDGLPVRKHYVTFSQTNVVNGNPILLSRKFLVEEISWRFAAPQIAKLAPSQHAFAPAKMKTVSNVAFNQVLLPSTQGRPQLDPPDRHAAKAKMRMAESQSGRRAALNSSESSFWVDFDLVNCSGDIVLEGGKTWYVSGVVTADSLVIEPTAVIKMTNGASLTVLGEVSCLTTNYAPAIFTAYNDNTVGEVISEDAINDSSRSANVALSLGNGGDLHNLQIRYAGTAIYSSEHPVSLRDLVFTHCDSALDIESTSFSLENALIWDVSVAFYGSFFQGNVEHLTFDEGDYLTSDWNYHSGIGCDTPTPPSSQITLVNSLLTAYGDPGNVSLVYTNDTVWLADNTGVFAHVGTGGHYLATDSPYRAVGTGAIHPELTAMLAKKTTYPPVVFQGTTYTGSTNLAPQVQRETTFPFDLGYAYDAIDIAFGAVDFDNTQLKIAPGTGIATFWASPNGSSGTYGLNFTDAASVQCAGTPDKPVHFCHYNMVMEQVGTNWAGNETLLMDDGSCPSLNFRFTDWSVAGNQNAYISLDNQNCGAYGFQDCEFRGGTIATWGPTLTMMNCLLDRVDSTFYGTFFCDLNPVLRDCLFRGGVLSLNKESGGVWVVQDTLFDQTLLYQAHTLDTVSHNGYIAGSSHLETNSGFDVFLGTSPAYQRGPLGGYYYPTNLTLINVGSQNATNAGLFHYTTTTNEVKETNSIVDIGFHYVAVGTNGLPLNYDNDGVADYAEDGNGNGVSDGSETDWKVSNANTPPTWTVPGAQTAYEDEPVYFSGLVVGDSDAGTNDISIFLSCVHGTLNLTATNGLVFLTGTNGVTSYLTIEGSISNLNVAFATLSYLGEQGYYGPDFLSLSANDLGNTGNDGAKTATNSVGILLKETPAGIAGLKLWLRADKGVVTNGLGHVSQWTDQTANHNNFAQGTYANQPVWITNMLNGHPVIHFTPADETKLIGGAIFNAGSNTEAFVVCRVATNRPSVGRGLWYIGQSGSSYPNTTGEIVDTFAESGTHNLGILAQSLDQFHIYHVTSVSNGLWTAAINGQTVFSQNSKGTFFVSSPQLGASTGTGGYFDGDIVEIVMYQKLLDTDEKRDVEGYLAQKYALFSTPAAPTNLAAFAISQSQVSLNWKYAITNSSTRFQIERNDGAGFALVAEVDDASSYIDGGRSASTLYYYRVKAVNAEGESSYSATNSATTPATGTAFSTTNLKLWLQADSGHESDRVNFWRDQSEYSHHFSRVLNEDWGIGVVSDAINGHAVLHFVASTNSALAGSYIFDNTTSREAFVVLRVATNHPSSGRGLWYPGRAGMSYPNTDGEVVDNFEDETAHNLQTIFQPIDQFHIYHVTVVSNGLWTASINGLPVKKEPQHGIFGYGTDFVLGASCAPNAPFPGGFFDGDVAEVLIYDQMLNSNEVFTTETYLARKYALFSTPSAPSNLTAAAISPTQISLNWQGNLTNSTTRFVVERSSGGAFARVGVVENSFSLIDGNLSPNNTYYYRVKSMGFNGESGYSNTNGASTFAFGESLPLSNLKLWLAADKGFYPGKLDYWRDQSGNGNDASQADTNAQPTLVSAVINGKPVTRFSSSSQSLVFGNFLNGMPAGEIFAVLKVAATNPVSDRHLWLLGDSTTSYPAAGGQISEGFGITVRHDFNSASPLDQFHIYNVASKNGYFEDRMNGVVQFNSSSATASFNTSPSLGGSFDGDIAEIMLFSRTLSVGERDAAGTYLQNKYLLNTNTVTSPTSLLATGVSSSQLNLSWNSSSTNSLSFTVQRKTGSGGAYSTLATVYRDYSNYLDGAVLPGTNYYYRVQANNYASRAMMTNEICPPLAALTDISPLLAGTNFTVGVSVSDNDGSVAKVEFMTNGVLVGTSTNAPFNGTLTNMFLASAPLTARATDNQGNSRISAPIAVVISGDRDGDGVSDLVEIANGTDPTVPDVWTPPAPSIIGPIIYLDEPEGL